MKYFSNSVDIVDEMCEVDHTIVMEKKDLKEGYCITGVFECAHVLETSPDSVQCCILPGSNNSSTDLSIRMQHTLIEAYCWENEIELVKLSSNEDIRSYVTVSTLDGKDLNCILICDKEMSSDCETDYTDLESDDDSYGWPS